MHTCAVGQDPDAGVCLSAAGSPDQAARGAGIAFKMEDSRNDACLKLRKYRLYAAALSAESRGIQKDALPLAVVLVLAMSVVSTGQSMHAHSSYFPPLDVH